jgi:hypothetical protein
MITSHKQIMPPNQSSNMQKFASPVIALNNFHMGRNQSTPTSSAGIMIKSQHIWGGQMFQSEIPAGILTALCRLHIKYFHKSEN